MNSKMEALDITSDGLRNQGYTLKKEGSSIALYHNNNGCCYRWTLFKNDWDKTTNRADEKLSEYGIPKIVIEAVKADMSRNYNTLVNGAATEAAKASVSGLKLERPLSAEEIGESLTLEKWTEGLLKRHQQLQDIIKNAGRLLPHLLLPLEYVLSVKNILHIQDCTLPFAGILLGVPSSLKTVAIELLRAYWHGYYKDDFSPKGWVSHYSGLTEEQLQKNDLLPQIKYKLFLTPELAPLFTGNEDDLKKSFGNLTRILDGKGLQSHSGTQGDRGYYGEYMFAWCGAAVDVSPRVHRMMGNLGPKMYFLRLPKAGKKEQDIIEQLKNPQFTIDLEKIQRALFEYLIWFEACPIMQPYKDTKLLRLSWDYERNDVKALKFIARLSLLIAHLRGVVETWETQGTQGSDYAYAPPIIEEPDRAATQLFNLARGHALNEGRNYITMADIPMLIKVVLSTAPLGRAIIFDLLLQHGGKLVSSDIRSSLQFSRPTVLRAMTELMVLRLVDGEQEGESDNSPKSIELKHEFRWCLSRTFRQLREGFSPMQKSRKYTPFGKMGSNQGDNMDEDYTKRKEKSEEGKVDFPSRFWVSWNAIEKATYTLDGATITYVVSRGDLKKRLMRDGVANDLGAEDLIDRAFETGRIRKIVDDDTLEKNSQSKVSDGDLK
jgi:hypothetical protein